MAQETTITPPKYTEGPLTGSLVLTCEGEALRRITPDEIALDFRRALLRMNEKSCEWYIERYSGKRNRFVPAVRDRLRDIRRAKKDVERQKKSIDEYLRKEEDFQSSFRKFHTKLKHIHRYTVMCSTGLLKMDSNTEEYRNDIDVAIRNIGNMIHDLVKVYTGLMSFDAWVRKRADGSYDPTFEHYYPRSVIGGEDIIAQAMIMIKKNGGIELKDMLRTIYECSQGNKTTADENRVVLPPFQKHDTFTCPEDSYDWGNITLVREQEFTIPRVWLEIQNVYNIALPSIPDFRNVITTEEAEEMLTQMG